MERLQDPEFTVEQARDLLAEDDAMLLRGLDDQSIPLLGDHEIVRGWEVDSEDFARLVAFLETYTSANNDAPRKYVENPQANQQEHPGRYRQAVIRRMVEGEVVTLVQVLRKGFINNLVTDGAIDYTEARVRQVRDVTTEQYNPTSERYLEIFWPNVSPDRVQAIAASLRGLPSAAFAPTVRGESYGSGWHRLFVTYQIETDGSATITMFLAMPEVLAYGYSMYATERNTGQAYLWSVPKDLAQPIVDAYKAKGRSAQLSYQATRGVFDIVLSERTITDYVSIEDWTTFDTCDRTSVTTYYWGIETPGDVTIPPSAAGVQVDSSVSSNGDGTYDVIVRVTTRSARSYSDRDIVVSTLLERTQRLHFGLTSDAQIPDISTPVQGVVYSQNVRRQDDCSIDVSTEADIAKAMDIGQILVATSVLQDAYESVSMNKTTTGNASAAVQGVTYQKSSRMNQFGLYDESERATLSKANQFAFSALDTPVRSENVVQYKGQLSPVMAPVSANGVSYAVQQSISQDGTYDANVMLGIAKAHEFAWKSDNKMLSVGYEATYSGHPTPIEASDAALGIVSRTSNRLDENGTYVSTKMDVYSREAEIYLTWLTQQGRAAMNVFRNKTTIPSLAGVVGTDLNSISISINDDHTYDGIISQRPPFVDGNQALALLDFQDKIIFWEQASNIDAAKNDMQVYIYNSTSLNTVASFINDGGVNLQGTNIRYVGTRGDNRWQAHRIRKKA